MSNTNILQLPVAIGDDGNGWLPIVQGTDSNTYVTRRIQAYQVGNASTEDLPRGTEGYAVIGNGVTLPATYQGFDASGADAETRTWQDKGRDIISVMDFIPETLHAGIRDRSNTADLHTYIQNGIDNVASSSGATLYFPEGTYKITDQLLVSTSRMNLVGAGRWSTTILFAPTASGSCIKFSAGASTIAQCSLRGIKVESADDTYTKVAIDLWDVSGFILDDIQVSATPSAGFTGWSGGVGSVGLNTHGREGSSVSNANLFADKPIQCSVNPNNSISLDHFSFSNLYLLGSAHTGNFPLITVDTGSELSNVSFSGYQAWVAGTHGFYWVDTTSTTGSLNLSFENIRMEQTVNPSTSNFVYLDKSGVANALYGLSFKNCYFGFAKGFYLRNVNNVAFDTVITASTREILNVDSTTHEMEGRNCSFQTGSTSTLTDQRLVFASPTYPSSAGMPPNFKYTGTATSDAYFHTGSLQATLNVTSPLPTAPTGTIGWFANADTVSSRVLLDAWGTGANGLLTGRMARGTAASPTAAQSADTLLGISAYGYGASAYSSASRAQMLLAAGENWTNTAQGTYFSWLTTATGGTSTTEKMRLNPAGWLGIATTLPLKQLQVGNGTDAVLLSAFEGINVSQLGSAGIELTDSTNHITMGFGAGGSSTFLGTRTNHPLYFQINGNNKLGINVSGGLSFGNSTWAADTSVPAQCMAIQGGTNTGLLLGGTAASLIPGAKLDIQNVAATSSHFLTVGGSTTAYAYGDITSTGGNLRIGLDNSAGGGLVSGGLAYAGIIGTANATALEFITNNVIRATITSGGNFGIGLTNASQLLTLATGGSLAWDNGSGTADTGVSKVSAGVVGIGTGAAASVAGKLWAGLAWAGAVSTALSTLTGASDGFRASAANVTQLAAENTTASSSTQGGMVGMYSNDGAAMASGDRLGGIRMGGSSSASALRNSAGVFAFADEGWVDATAYGSRLEFQNTTNGATTLSTKASLSNAGVFSSLSGHISYNATATPAAASAVAMIAGGSALVGVYFGTGDPNTALTAPKGSLYVKTDATTTTTRLWINTDGFTAWTFFTSNA